MTEVRGKPKRRPSAAPVFLASMALFCLLLGLVAYRAGSGSPADVAAASAPVPKRKLVVRRVVTTVVPASGSAPSAEAGSAASPTAEAAPVETAPVEPVPVTTSSS
jgi:hypothetical protein